MTPFFQQVIFLCTLWLALDIRTRGFSRDLYIHRYSSLQIPSLLAKFNAYGSLAVNSRKARILLSAAPIDNTELIEETPPKGSITPDINTEDSLLSSYIVLAVLLLTFVSNQWSRQAIYYLCDFSSTSDTFKHINAALNFSKDMYASLASLGFTVVFALVSLFAGNISDRFDRRTTLTASCAVWSVATALHGRAEAFSDLIPLRAIVGASQAFFNPAAYTLIADIFPQRMVGSINGIFSSGIFLGGALASLSILLDEQVGWRFTMAAIGGVGLVTALLCTAVAKDPRSTQLNATAVDATGAVISSKESAPAASSNTSSNLPVESVEPVEPVGPVGSIHMAGTMEDGEGSNDGTDIRDVDPSRDQNNIYTVNLQHRATEVLVGGYQALLEVTESREAKLLFAASAVRFCAGFSLVIWKAPFVFAKFPGSEAAFAGSNAAIVALGGLASSLLGGYLSDWIANPQSPTTNSSSSSSSNIDSDTSSSSTDSDSTASGSDTTRRHPRARSWVSAVGSFLAAPFWAGFILAPTPELAAACLFFEYLSAECWFGPTLASLFNTVPASRRGAAQGLFSVLTAAGNLGPVLVGALASGTVPGVSPLLSHLLTATATATAGATSSTGSSSSLGLDLGSVLLAVVCGSYLLSGALFTLAAVEEDRKLRLLLAVDTIVT